MIEIALIALVGIVVLGKVCDLEEKYPGFGGIFAYIIMPGGALLWAVLR